MVATRSGEFRTSPKRDLGVEGQAGCLLSGLQVKCLEGRRPPHLVILAKGEVRAAFTGKRGIAAALGWIPALAVRGRNDRYARMSRRGMLHEFSAAVVEQGYSEALEEQSVSWVNIWSGSSLDMIYTSSTACIPELQYPAIVTR